MINIISTGRVAHFTTRERLACGGTKTSQPSVCPGCGFTPLVFVSPVVICPLSTSLAESVFYAVILASLRGGGKPGLAPRTNRHRRNT